eukprot:119019_1
MQPTSERSEKDEEVRWKAIATIARLLAMGYSETSVQQALQHRGCEFDAALEWLLDHEMSEYADEDVFATSKTGRDVKVKIPAVTHNERRWFNSSDSDHHHHQKKEERPIQITRTTPPDRRKNVVTSPPNIRTYNSHESSSLPSPRRRTKVVELQDSNDEAHQQRDVIVRRLCDLGYSNTVVGQALNHVGKDFDEALNWLLDHDNISSSTEDDDGDWVIEEKPKKRNNNTGIESALSPSKIEMQLYSLGYSIEVVGRALNQVGSEFDAALNWLLDHYGSGEDYDNVVIAAESHCNTHAAYSSFESSSSTLHQRLQVDDLSLHSKQQQPTMVTTPLQHFNDDSPSSVDRREQRRHTNVNNGASGLLSSSSNEYVVDSSCIQSKNDIIESGQETHGNTNMLTEVVPLECLDHNYFKSEDSLQPIGSSCFSKLLNDQATAVADIFTICNPLMQCSSTVDRRGEEEGRSLEYQVDERGSLGSQSRDNDGSSSAEWYDDMFHPHKALEEETTTDEDIIPLINEERVMVNSPLPIDLRKDIILQHIEANRVTVIEGETGCGKSSRIPQMLMEFNPKARMYVSQPRRIAAYALMKHVRNVLVQKGENEMKVGLRCGHGFRNDSTDTQILFCTTGYLVRLLAHHQEQFKDHTHLIIDEVHERSMDTDILCFLAKLLLSSHPTIKLILMSATMAADMYRDYFSVEAESIHVGSQRYPTNILYCDEIARMVIGEETMNQYNSELSQCLSMSTISTCASPQKDVVQSQKTLVLMLISWLGKMVERNNPQEESSAAAAGAILVFVSGMADILELTEKLEKLKNTSRFKIVPIHSAFGFDEQLDAFEPVEKGVLKVVIATNAAESSLTLPDIDHVICLGTAKALESNDSLNRELLTVRWISKSSAKQRAGRTGRVRRGTVYRMYTREAYESFDEYDTAEILRRPLDSVILDLKAMLDQTVVPLLNSVLQPPSITHVDKALESLFKQRFITEPSDVGRLTMHGKFVARLGLDLQVGTFVALGIQFGCLAEAVIIAAAISFNKRPFRVVSPLIYAAPDEFNRLMADVVKSSVELDSGWYCEPMIVAQILWDCSSLESHERDYYCRRHFLCTMKVQQLSLHAKHIANRVESILGRPCPLLNTPPYALSLSKRNTIRMILLWSFHTNLIVTRTACTVPPSSGPFTINVEESLDVPAEEVLKKVVPPNTDIIVEDSRCSNFVYTAIGKNGSIYIGETWGDETDVHKSFLQLGCNVKNLDACWIVGDNCFSLHLTSEAVRKVGKNNLVNIFRDTDMQKVVLFKQEEESNKTSKEENGVEKHQNSASSSPMFHLTGTQTAARRRELQLLREILPTSLSALTVEGTLTVYSCGFDPGEESLKHVFFYKDDPDHLDWNFHVRTWQRGQKKTKMVCAWSDPPFPLPPLLVDLPIAARQIGQMAAGQRGRMLKCWACCSTSNASPVATNVAERVESEMVMEEGSRNHDKEMPCGEEMDQKVEFWIDVPIPSWRCVQNFRGHNAKAIIPEGTLGAAVVPNLQPQQNTYVVATNMLDVGFGNVTRADCLTLFPPGENWVHLGLVAYGLEECATMRKYGREEEEQFFPVDMKPFTSGRDVTTIGTNLSFGDEYANQQAGQDPVYKLQHFALQLRAATAFSVALQMAPSIETQPLLICTLDEIFGFSHCREEYDDVVFVDDELKSPSFCLQVVDDFKTAVDEALALAKAAHEVRLEANNMYWASYSQG